MLRAIIQNKKKDILTGLETQSFISVDFENNDIESLLRSGGKGENGYDYKELIGVELVKRGTNW